MAQYQANVWLGQNSGQQKVYVDSNTWQGAREQIIQRYGVDWKDIWNLREVRRGWFW